MIGIAGMIVNVTRISDDDSGKIFQLNIMAIDTERNASNAMSIG